MRSLVSQTVSVRGDRTTLSSRSKHGASFGNDSREGPGRTCSLDTFVTTPTVGPRTSPSHPLHKTVETFLLGPFRTRFFMSIHHVSLSPN